MTISSPLSCSLFAFIREVIEKPYFLNHLPVLQYKSLIIYDKKRYQKNMPDMRYIVYPKEKVEKETSGPENFLNLT